MEGHGAPSMDEQVADGVELMLEQPLWRPPLATLETPLVGEVTGLRRRERPTDAWGTAGQPFPSRASSGAPPPGSLRSDLPPGERAQGALEPAAPGHST